MIEDLHLEAKGGNSPIRFYIIIDEKKIGMAKRALKRSWKKDLWIVQVYNEQYRQLISDYMLKEQGIEHFYWNYIK